MRAAGPAAAIVLAGWTAIAAAQNEATPAAPAPTLPGTPASAPPPADAAPSTPAPAANLEALDGPDARSVLGKKVSGAAGEDMGLVVDLLFDANKEPRAVVIDFGGFLGVGTRKIAVDWRLLQFYAPDSKTPLKLDLTRADVQSAPEYKPDEKKISVIAGPGRVAPAATPSEPPETPPPAPTPSAAPAPSSPAPAAGQH